jgi:hypothetical protein
MTASWRKRGATRLTLAVLALFVCAFSFAPTALAQDAGGDEHLYDNDQAPKDVVHRHFLKMYKVEQHQDLEGDEYITVRVQCTDPYDLATDGMWRIDHVDQDEYGNQPLADIDVYAAYSDPNDPSTYVFEIFNNSEGRAQMKLFLTCLGWKTEPNSHRHKWSLKPPAWRSYDYDRGLGQHAFGSGNADCDKGEIAVSPGYQWTRGFGELYKSTAITGDDRGWEWGFFVTLLDDTTNDAQARVSFRCLKLRSSSYQKHHHKIMWAFRPTYPAPLTKIAAETTETRTRSCGLHEKAMVHSFDLDPELYGQNVWYLGQDPRIKSRAYKVRDDNTWDVWVSFGAVCFNDRTSRKYAG